MTIKLHKIQCPPDWKPVCCCSPIGTAPSEECYHHGYPDGRFCPYCGKFRYNNVCKHCGCNYGIIKQD